MNEHQQKQTFNEWLNSYKGILFKVLRAYAFTADDRDDLFQDMCLQLWHSIPNFRGEAAPTTWIYRVALNTAIRFTRKASRHRQTHQPLEGAEHLLRHNEAPADERLAWLYREIARLDPIDRSLTLLLLDGCSYKEMAAIAGISESNVGVKIHRIKKHLIARSEQYDYHGI